MTTGSSSAHPGLTTMQPGVGPQSSAERWAVRMILALFVVVGINCIHNDAYIGQDFGVHVMCMEHLEAHPWQWFSFDSTNRPVVYWIAIACDWFSHGKSICDLAALVYLLSNAIALGLLHDCSRRFITSPLVRVTAVTFVAFLPPVFVTSVVFAADAVAQLPFALVAWTLLRGIEAGPTRVGVAYVVLAGFTLCLGNLAKLTFILLPAATLVIPLVLWRWQRLSGRRALAMIAATAVMPAIMGAVVQRAAHRAVAKEEVRHIMDWKGTDEMNWSSVLLLKRTDTRIFDAPGYFDPSPVKDTRLPLLEYNGYSYPALFHLAVFTDVLDYANKGSADNGVPRPEPQKKWSRLAVWFGLPFSATAVLAVLAFSGRMLLSLFRPRFAPATGLMIWGLMAFAWYLPLVLVLPYLHNAYEWGYWLPRLVMPALWGFALILFATVDELLAQRRYPAIVLAVCVLVQAAVHVRSIWY